MDVLLIAGAAAFVIGAGVLTVIEQRRTDIEWAGVTNDATFALPGVSQRSFRAQLNDVRGVFILTASDRLTYVPGEYPAGTRLCIELNEGEITEFRTARLVGHDKCQ